MIVESKLVGEYASLPKSHKVWYSCDYCGKEFEREIKVRERGLDKCPKDSCGEKDCKNKKKAEGYLIRFGVTHNSQLPDVKEKKVVKIKAKMPATLEKMKQTNLERYGAEFASQTESVKEKMKQTCLSTYGTVSSLLNEDVKEKTKQTNLRNFGVEFPMQSEEVKAKREETNLERFGVPHASQSEEVKNKIIESNLARYGVPYSGMADEIKEKIAQTNLERYGFENPLENEEINDKRMQTNLERYGTAHTGQVEEFKQKAIQTNIERYGVAYAIQSRKILEKMIQSNLQRYGVISPSMLDEIKEKVKKTCLERFGFEHAAQSEEVREKIKTSMIENHGVENALQNPNIKAKQTKSMLEIHGHEHALQVPEFKEKAQKTLIQNYGVDSPLKSEEIKEKYKNTSKEKYGTDHPLSSDEVRQKIEETNIERYGVPCVLFLQENRKYGKTQEDIKQYLNSFEFDFKSNHSILNGKEIDLYDDSIKIGFEYCGLYWHNELSPEPRTRKYHWDKYRKCAAKEIRLITIFEDEWIKRNSQCKNFIKSILNKNSIKIFARKCEIKPIEKLEFQAFCHAYHIQGANKLAVICYGLFHNGEMIGGISLGKHHRHGQELILDRLCFKDDISVIGGSSKLFKACVVWAKENGFSTIGSWSDNRWSAGGVYKKLGFELADDGKPDYSYVDITKKCKRRSKQSQRKPKGETRTEREICLEKGLVRIWDCGKKKWVFNIT